MSEKMEQTDLVIRAITALGVFMAGFKGLASLFTMAGRGIKNAGKLLAWWKNRRRPRRRRYR